MGSINAPLRGPGRLPLPPAEARKQSETASPPHESQDVRLALLNDLPNLPLHSEILGNIDTAISAASYTAPTLTLPPQAVKEASIADFLHDSGKCPLVEGGEGASGCGSLWQSVMGFDLFQSTEKRGECHASLEKHQQEQCPSPNAPHQMPQTAHIRPPWPGASLQCQIIQHKLSRFSPFH